MVFQAQRAFDRHRAADHHALIVRVVQADPTGREQVLHQIAVAQLLIAGAVHHVRMGGLIDLVVHGNSYPSIG